MANLEWKYVKPLVEGNIIEKFEEYSSFKFSESFISCIKTCNGGRPSKKIFDTDKSKGRTIQHLFSFNKEDRSHIWRRYDIFTEIAGGSLIPFAANDFGNTICFERKTGHVVFLNHEDNSIEFIADSFDGFLNALYNI